ncbi:hypothetical protein LUZ60_005357 [Juncus effusus]|nr:hypothetical protein LUZ60_005357 [Juncus effusus]
MGKTGKWLKNLLTGKKDKDKDKPNKEKTINSTPVPKEKRRWSFRRPSESRKDLNSADQSLASTSAHGFLETRIDPDRNAVAVAVATAAAADAAVAAAQAAAAMIRLTTTGTGNGRRRKSAVEEMAAVKIQSVFRSYLARKALCALKGLVKLQALVRGHLVRRQATETLRCMQALVAVQKRACLQRIQMLEEEDEERGGSKCRTPQRQRSVRNSPMHPRSRQSHDNGAGEENVKIVEVDVGQTRSLSASRSRHDHQRSGTTTPRKPAVSPSLSAMTEMSPRTYSGHFDEFSFTTAQSGGGCSPSVGGGGYYASDMAKSPFGTSQDYPLFPNYMANTKSSRAKARSQSAPKQRPLDSFERQSSARRTSLEGRNIPKLGVRMQRSASQVGPAVNSGGAQYQFHYPWSVKLDKSSASLKDSECGSTSTVLTTTSYYSTILAQEVHGRR